MNRLMKMMTTPGYRVASWGAVIFLVYFSGIITPPMIDASFKIAWERYGSVGAIAVCMLWILPVIGFLIELFALVFTTKNVTPDGDVK